LYKLEDTYKHKGLRKKLIDSIREKRISDENVLEAMNKIPRHLFLDSSFVEFAYQDKPFPIGAGQTISQPYTVAFQSQLLDIHKGDKVLEIGTGSGYQACVLAQMGAKVFSIERQKSLYLKNKKLIQDLGYTGIKFFFGDGYKGLPAFAPFDKMIVTAGAPFVPEPLKEQIKVGGILVIPVGRGDIQIMKSIIKTAPDKYEVRDHGTFSFVPLLEDKENNSNKTHFNI
jgi:protein-L-isoaspartate(D-aspartate) O-methyltransferase